MNIPTFTKTMQSNGVTEYRIGVKLFDSDFPGGEFYSSFYVTDKLEGKDFRREVASCLWQARKQRNKVSQALYSPQVWTALV